MREQVERCLLSYTRGIDRLDGELVAAAFHPGAVLEGYGSPDETTIEAFVDRAMTGLRAGYAATQHRMTNTTIEERGNHVAVETYVLAFHIRENDDAPDQLFTFNGRYVDRFTEVDGQWRIAHRRLRYDWSTVDDIHATMPGDWVPGARDRNDAAYG